MVPSVELLRVCDGVTWHLLPLGASLFALKMDSHFQDGGLCVQAVGLVRGAPLL